MNALRMLAVAGFALAGLLVVAVEWAARRDGSRIPSLGDVAAVVMSHEVGGLPVGRIAVFGFWWWIGWHFLAR
ncbi:hypothetical protein F4553_005724 [Allocatelliglobosispora scoriae]|uniref:Uncharacterized protein n=1 Tax=Allocatelliglobosispora scoriae TaxID=643052 RepID=A0A841C006_9ACTN|nr:DUF6186 family protein [Allocatelliglobosispora scoriae]MBB5872290.1 hypothetical protein [Allocatelliglobosispora scoriae]